MTGLGQDHRDRLPLVSMPRAQTSPSPACGGTSELSCHGSQPLRLEKKFATVTVQCNLVEPCVVVVVVAVSDAD